MKMLHILQCLLLYLNFTIVEYTSGLLLPHTNFIPLKLPINLEKNLTGPHRGEVSWGLNILTELKTQALDHFFVSLSVALKT